MLFSIKNESEETRMHAYCPVTGACDDVSFPERYQDSNVFKPFFRLQKFRYGAIMKEPKCWLSGHRGNWMVLI